MKTTLKKWHIALMSFLTLFIAVFASLFSLRADTVDEETGEVLTDNWELGVVFYDSSVDNAIMNSDGTYNETGKKTPLTEINWDASDGSYKEGTPRIIIVQINYKNNSAVTTYQPGEVVISIPNLYYQNSVWAGSSSYPHEGKAVWNAKVMVGANDSTHSGYDWNYISSASPDYSRPAFNFSNAKVIEEKANFEGSIQIIYTITPGAESMTGIDKIEKYEAECTHIFSSEVRAVLHTSHSESISSPNYPNYYPTYMTESKYFWEYSKEGASEIVITFDKKSALYTDDYIYIYNKEGLLLYTLTGYEMMGKSYSIPGDYMKITMTSDGFGRDVGFKAYITEIYSDTIHFNYQRTYIHPWKYQEYQLIKKAEKITSYDLLGNNPEDYIWIKYFFSGYSSFEKNDTVNYPNIPVTIESSKIYDVLPTECICYSTTGERIMPVNENGLYIFENITSISGFYVFVGYPKSIYNEENENLQIINTADYYGIYLDKTEQEKLSTASVSINLADFRFNYDGNLYGIIKEKDRLSQPLRYQDIINNWQYNSIAWKLRPTVYYTGEKLTVKIGDDLLYYLDSSNEYTKLTDNDYYFSRLHFFDFHNGNGLRIKNGKYNCELWVRYAGNTEYSLFEEFTIGNGGKTSDYDKDGEGIFELPSDLKVVGFYFLIKDLEESIVAPLTGYSATSIDAVVKFTKNNISESGTLYNFCYLQVFTKDKNNNLTLINEPTVDSYDSLITKEAIATYDQETYGTYMQRSYNSINWKYYSVSQLTNEIFSYKKADSVIQDIEKEVFTGNFTIAAGILYEDSSYFDKNYIEQYNENSLVTGFYIYDLLPEGMKLTSTKEEIFNSTNIFNGETTDIYYDCKNKTKFNWEGVYDKNGNAITPIELYNNIINSTTIEITENWNNTNRTHIKIYVDLTEHPLMLSGWPRAYIGAYFTYNYEISYESYLEFGNIWKNSIYSHFSEQSSYKKVNTSDMFFDFKLVSDSGENDIQAKDINSNNNLTENLSQFTATITLTSIVSTHQDVTTYVKTNQSNYSTGIVDTSNDSEYDYKLRVRTGAADITNLIIYSNLEEAQPERTRWKGEFLGFDTSHAQNKGYNVKTYWSENPQAGNLYNEDGSLNSNWSEYIFDIPAVYKNGLEITFNSQCKTENVRYDYIEIYYTLDGKIYKLGPYGGSDLADKTIQVPTFDFYLYWKTDTSVCNYYGFTIDSISSENVENTTGTVSTMPNYAIEEITGTNYPDSAFDSYSHGNYGNNVKKIWHYVYNGEKEIITEQIPGTDRSKVKSLAFEYLDNEGNSAVIPSNSLTYVLINMKSPVDENIKTLARMDCWTQWNAIDDFGQPVDFITGINSNVVKVALPNSVKEDSVSSISLRFTKEIEGTDFEFENMKLDKAAQQTFMIKLTSLTENDDGSYNQLTALLKSNQELIISQIPVGTYLLEELGDNYFDFVEFADNNDPEIVINGVTFERTDEGYMITVSESLTENVEFNIQVINEIEPERFYEDKENKENLFLKNKIEEDA